VLRINGTEEAVRKLTLEPGARQEVTFSIARNNADTYAIDVNGLSGSFVVRETPASVPPSPSTINWWLIAGITAGVVVVVTLVCSVLRRAWY
jgi:hypothetical protein